MPEIELVGLGRMGLPICANLVRAGYRVLAGDRRPEAARQAAWCGARWVPEVGRLAAGADVLIKVVVQALAMTASAIRSRGGSPACANAATASETCSSCRSRCFQEKTQP